MISKADYCMKICKAKCCTHKAMNYTCSNLAPDCSCKIYQKRFAPESPESEVVDQFERDGKTYQLICGRIEKLIERGLLDPEVQAQCCYANPSLLEGVYHGTETNS